MVTAKTTDETTKEFKEMDAVETAWASDRGLIQVVPKNRYVPSPIGEFEPVKITEDWMVSGEERLVVSFEHSDRR